MIVIPLLCFVAIGAALAGTGAVGLALGFGVGGSMLIAAPLLGAVSLLAGLAAGWLVLMRADRRIAGV